MTRAISQRIDPRSLVALALAAVSVAILGYHAHTLSGQRSSDFVLFYQAVGRFLADPATLYHGYGGVQGAAKTLNGFLYPPPGILPLLPIGMAGMDTTFPVFRFATLIAAVLALWLWLRALRRDAMLAGDRIAFIAALVMALASGPVLSCRFGQVDSFILLLLVIGMSLICGATAGRLAKFSGGFVLALGSWLKIYPAFIMATYTLGRPRDRVAVSGFMVGAVLVPAVAFIWIPASVWREYFVVMLPEMSQRTIINIYNQSLSADILRLQFGMARGLDTFDTLPVPLWLRLAVLGIAGAVVAISAAIHHRAKGGLLPLLATAMAAIGVVAPLGWGHTYVYVTPLLSYTLARSFEGRSWRAIAFCVAVWCVFVIPSYSKLVDPAAFPLLAAAFYSRYAIGVALLIGLCWRWALADGRADPGGELSD